MKAEDKTTVHDIGCELKELEDLLTERIVDLYEVKGGMQARHAYVFYRERVQRIKELVKKL